MRHKPIHGVMAIVAMSIVSISAGDVASEVERRFQLTIGGIKAGLDRSPNDYIAALVETAGPTQCIDRGAEEICFHEARIIELFANHGNEVREGSLIQLLGEGILGARSLFFVVPVDTDVNIYGGTYGQAKPKKRDEAQFRDALSELGLGKDA